MPRSRLIHAICHYHGQWLPGDPRGWRSRGHKTHSSGDYRNPPPASEHREQSRQLMKGAPVRLTVEERAIVGDAFLDKLHMMDVFIHRFACGPTHTHFLYESVAADAVKEVGRAKQYASLRLQDRPGRIWAKGAKIIEVRDADHESKCARIHQRPCKRRRVGMDQPGGVSGLRPLHLSLLVEAASNVIAQRKPLLRSPRRRGG